MSAARFTEVLTKRGHACSCLCLQGSRLHLELSRNGQATFSIRAKDYFSPPGSLRIRKLVKHQRVQIVHSHRLSDLWLVTPALWGLSGVKLFGTLRVYFTKLKKRDVAHRLIYRRLETLFTTTEIAKNAIAKNLPLRPERISVLPNGVDLSIFNPNGYSRRDIGEELGLREEDFVIGLVARINPGKGQLELVRAAKKLKQKYPGLKYLLVGEITLGEGQEHKRMIEDLISESGLSENFILTAFREDIPRVLKALDLFVIPSYQETFGNTALEAMAMGVPIIATDAGGLPEILADCGLLISPRQSGPLAEAIEFLIENTDQASELAKKARRRVEEVYDQEVIFGKLEQIYSQSLEN